MATNRPRNFDVNKPFICCETLEEFNNLNNNDNAAVGNNKKESIDVKQETKPAIKQKIDIPITQKIKDNIIYTGLTQTEKKIKHQMGYIRVQQKENLPDLGTYELNDQDYAYFNEYKIPDTINREQFLSKMQEFIAFLEEESTKNMTKPWSDEMYNKILKHFEEKEKQEQKQQNLGKGDQKKLFSEENGVMENEDINNSEEKMSKESKEEIGQNNVSIIQQFTKDDLHKFYIYWESQRKSLNRALLRKFYPANHDDLNPQAAFRPRMQDRMRLRNKGKQNDQENIQKFQNLKREFEEQEAILKCIKAREHIKFEQTVLQSNQFMEDLFSLDENTDFKYLGKFECQGKSRYEDVKQEFMNNHSFQNQKENFDNLMQEIKNAQEGASKLLKQAAKNALNNQDKIKHEQNNYNSGLSQASKLKAQKMGDLNVGPIKNQGQNKYIKVSNYANSQLNKKQQREQMQQLNPELLDYNQEFDLASFMAALIQESKLTPADLFNPSTLNEKKGIQQISKKDRKQREKELKKQQDQLLFLQKQKEEQMQLEELQKQQKKLQKQKMYFQKCTEQKDLEQSALTKDILRNPIRDFKNMQFQREFEVFNRKNTFTFNMYKAKGRSQAVQLYRSFDNLKYGNDTMLSQSFLKLHDQVYKQPEAGLRHKFVKTDDIVWSNANEDYQKTYYASNKCERFMKYLRFEDDMDKENEYLGLQHIQDDLFKNVKKGLKNAAQAYKEKQKNKNNNNKNNNNNLVDGVGNGTSININLRSSTLQKQQSEKSQQGITV